MTPEEIKKQHDELILEIKTLITESTKEGVNKTDLEAKIAEINKTIAEKLPNDEIANLKKSVDNLVAEQASIAAKLAAASEKAATTDKPVTFKDALIAAIMAKKDIPNLLTDKNDDNGQRKSLKDYFTERGNKTTPAFTINKAVDMLESNIVGSNVGTVRLAELDPQRVGIPLTIYPHVTDWMPSKTIARPTMSLLVVYSYSDGAGTKTEGSAPSQSSFLLKTVEFKSFYISTYFTLSDETLDDLNEAMEEIAVVGPSKILDNVDGQLLGTAGDDSSALAGLNTANKMTAFASSTTYANKVATANKVDVIALMKLQAEANKYNPDTVILNPYDIAIIATEKDQLDNSKVDRRIAFNVLGEPAAICGMRIVKSTGLTANSVDVLDSKQLMIGKRKDMTMEIGYNGSDLTEGQKTVVIKFRIAFGVRDKAAVIYCSDLDAAKSQIDVS